MSTEQSTLEQQLALLHQQYLTRLQSEIPELALQVSALATLSQKQNWRDEVKALKFKLHTLAGSAGTFGLPALGRLAKNLELELRSWMESPAAPDADQIRDFIVLFQQVQQTHQASHQVLSVTSSSQQKHTERHAAIYVLESNQETSGYIELTLTSFGYKVNAATTMAELKQLVDAQSPDALVLDISSDTEVGEGLDFVAKLQASLSTPIPVLILADEDSFEQHLAAVRIGAQGYFVKPLNTTALEARLQRLLAVRSREAFRVLIVDDDQLLAEHYALVLQGAGLRAEILSDPSKIYDSLTRFHPDVVLLDVNMPYCSGPELAQLIRLHDQWLSVPIIYLSSETDSDRQLAALVKGGDDFLTKPMSDTALIVAVFARAQRARQVVDMMTKDSLTGLLQHARVKERLTYELQRAERTGGVVSTIMIDIDLFKKVNDNYGHPVGDQVISSLANLMKQQLRKIDIVGRYGGEEYLVILSDCGKEHAFTVVEQLRKAFAAIPFSCGDSHFYCTFSAGISEWQHGMDTDQLIEQADQALYQAKRSGRNQTLIFDAKAL
ncbi:MULTISPECIES: diguanylate cyclase [Rheinheimera]|uniref:diguanylate cyclase n=1 Tax=Rheinheimera marina TaxID=1774958 RepID=A0ABV9JN84_9GAMM